MGYSAGANTEVGKWTMEIGIVLRQTDRMNRRRRSVGDCEDPCEFISSGEMERGGLLDWIVVMVEYVLDNRPGAKEDAGPIPSPFKSPLTTLSPMKASTYKKWGSLHLPLVVSPNPSTHTLSNHNSGGTL